MRTIQLSEDKARRLAKMLAPQWAVHATQLAGIAAGVDVNTPYRCSGEGLKDSRFLRRVDEHRKNTAVIAEVLTELGATVPKVDATTFVVPYAPSYLRDKRRKHKQIGTLKLREERQRLVAEILAQI